MESGSQNVAHFATVPYYRNDTQQLAVLWSLDSQIRIKYGLPSFSAAAASAAGCANVQQLLVLNTQGSTLLLLGLELGMLKGLSTVSPGSLLLLMAGLKLTHCK